MTLDACAGIVQKGDPDRFMAVMAAPVEARKTVLPIYAFNVEVARAPWASQEPIVAEMRLQWWWDVLEEIATGQTVRAHEVSTPLAKVIDAKIARVLQENVDARRNDAHRVNPESVQAVQEYLEATSGALMYGVALALGSDQELRSRMVGTNLGYANYLSAVPELIARGRRPWPETSGSGFRDHLKTHLALVENALRANRERPTRPQRIAELSAWQAKLIVTRAYRRPSAVGTGGLQSSDARKKWSLFWASLRV